MGHNLDRVNPSTAAIGFASLAFLFWVRRRLTSLLLRMGLGERAADIFAKVGPAVAIVVATAWARRTSGRPSRAVFRSPEVLRGPW